MLCSVVDDRSSTSYREYHVTFREDVETGLRFLYRAMAPKEVAGFPFEGIPKMIYTDNGPIARSRVFQRVMDYLGIELRSHLPSGGDGRRTTARSKGKVERPFRTVKELHETLYHFHQPENEKEANQWLLNFVLRYYEKKHRSESHSRLEDWVAHLPKEGIRKVCSWNRFATFAREPEQRKVGPDAAVSVSGISYQLASELAGETVTLWWGLFDGELFVEHGERRFGPFHPIGGPVPLHRFRVHTKSRAEKQVDSIEKLARAIKLPKEALTGDPRNKNASSREFGLPFVAFDDPDPFIEFAYPTTIEAKKAIADYLGIALAKLSEKDRRRIDDLLGSTLKKTAIFAQIRAWFRTRNQEVKDVR